MRAGKEYERENAKKGNTVENDTKIKFQKSKSNV